MPKQYVEYSSNNSGGSWWLTDQNWRDLEKAGWKVEWYTLEVACDEVGGDYIYEEDGTPKLISAVGKSYSAADKNGRFLGALARSAYKADPVSLREAVVEWERITGQRATDTGCACCGQPHTFSLYVDGQEVESGPSIRFEASWD